jgi:hypothetical protein
VLRVLDTNYPLCLLDTLAVSEMVKRPAGALRNFYEWSHRSEPTFLPCFTVYTLIELRRQPALFEQFIGQFHPFPCVLVKGYMNFLDEEVDCYPDPSQIDPCAIAFTPLGDEGNLLRNLPLILASQKLQEQERMWNEARSEIVEGMVSLVKDYLPEGDSYTADEVRQFVNWASFTQLTLHGHNHFVERLHAGDQAVEMDAFPSLKAMTFTVFHKFYADLNRTPSDSDAFDVLISSALPYVEAIITEAHLAEALRKTKRRDAFLDHLQVFTLRDFRDDPPPSRVLDGLR